MTYKPPPPPSPVAKKWYDSLSTPFPVTYCWTDPDSNSQFQDLSHLDPPIPSPTTCCYFEEVSSFFKYYFMTFGSFSLASHEEIMSNCNSKSVPGMPFPFKTKKEFYSSPFFSSYLSDLEENLVDFDFPFLWQVSQKYELRPQEKVHDRKIRTFLVAPADFCYLNNRYNLRFNEHFYSLHTSSFSCVGMSKYYGGYQFLYEQLRVNPCIFFGDFSKFDKKLSSSILLLVRSLRKQCILFPSARDVQVFDSLSNSVVNSLIVLEDGRVYQKDRGNPSGSPDTIVDNTISNYVIFLWFLRTSSSSTQDFHSMRQRVVYRCYGDDFLYTVPSDLAPLVNNANYFSFLLRWGMSAEGNVSPLFDWSSVSFLSHLFLPHQGFMLPCLDTNKMLNSLYLGGGSQHIPSPSYQALRALSLRIECWPNKMVVAYCEDYLRFLFSNYPISSVSYVAGDLRVSPKTLNSLNFSPQTLQSLYCGYESSFQVAVPGLIDHSAIKFSDESSHFRRPFSRSFVTAIFLFSLLLFVDFSSAMSTSRADRSLTKLESTLGLTDHGKAWLTAVLDPFHDEEIHNLVGLPDGQNSRSCVQIVRQTAQVTCPSSITSGTWDCSIISFPFFPPSNSITVGGLIQGFCPAVGQGSPSDMPNATFLCNTTVGQVVDVGGVGIYTAPTAGHACGPELSVATAMITPPSTFVDGEYRIISKGYEVASVGPDLYKSGTVYVWNQPSPSDSSSVSFNVQQWGGITASNSTFIPCMTFDLPPETVSAVNMIPNTKSWAAKDGVYVVDRFPAGAYDSYENNMASPLYRDTQNFTVAGPVKWLPSWGPAVSDMKSSVPPGWPGPPDFVTYSGNAISNYHHSGAYFTGLSLQDTLTINAIWYIERFPSVKQPDLLVLSKPTPFRDHVALELYSHALEYMPVGMKFNANGFGDWFNDVVGTISDFVSPVASVIGDILPGPIGMVAKGIGALTKKEKRKEEKKLEQVQSVNNAPSSGSLQVSAPHPKPKLKHRKMQLLPIKKKKK